MAGSVQSTLIKVGVTAFILALVSLKVDLSKLLLDLSKISNSVLVLGTALLLAHLLLVIPRWSLLLRMHEVNTISMRRLGSIGMISFFFNQILPTAVGGDVVRVWYLQKDGVRTSTAFSSVISDRLHGLLALIILLAIGLPSYLKHSSNVALNSSLIVITVGAAAAFIVVITAGTFLPKLAEKLRWLNSPSKLVTDFRRSVIQGKVFIPVLMLSLVSQLIPATVVWLISKSIGVHIDYLDCITVISATILFSMIPISFAGWGLREVGFITVAGSIGVAQQSSILISIVFGILLTVSALPGLVIWLQNRNAPKQNYLVQSDNEKENH